MQDVDGTMLRDRLPHQASREQKMLASSLRHRFFVDGFDHPLHEPDKVLILVVGTKPWIYARNMAPELDHVHKLMILGLRAEQTLILNGRM